jgi:hypothetical protein
VLLLTGRVPLVLLLLLLGGYVRMVNVQQQVWLLLLQWRTNSTVHMLLLLLSLRLNIGRPQMDMSHMTSQQTE